MLKSLRRKLIVPKLPWRKPRNKRQPIKRVNTEKQKKVIDKRKSTIRRRKNFVLSLFILIFLWLLLGAIIFFVDPSVSGTIGLFFVIAFITVTFTFSFLFINSRQGLIVGGFITIFLVLRYLGFGTLVNALLLLALAALTEYYLRNGT